MLVGFWFLMSHARAKARRYDVMLIFWHAVGSVDYAMVATRPCNNLQGQRKDNIMKVESNSLCILFTNLRRPGPWTKRMFLSLLHIILFSSHDTRVHGWSQLSSLTTLTRGQEHVDQQQLGRRQALSILSFTFISPVVLFADADIAHASDGISMDDIRSSLTPATAEKAIIPLTAVSAAGSSLQVVEGLLYYKNPRSERRPIATDTILITVRTSMDGPILAAARLPLIKIRLPLRFRMSERNAVRPEFKDEWKRALREEDLVIQATVCPEDSNSNSNTNSNSDATTISVEQICRNRDANGLQALGSAKLLRLQDGSVLRAPVSLPLG